jgi:hypothetical protein
MNILTRQSGLKIGEKNVEVTLTVSFEIRRQRLQLGSPTRGPPACIMRPAVTFVNYVHSYHKHYKII